MAKTMCISSMQSNKAKGALAMIGLLALCLSCMICNTNQLLNRFRGMSFAQQASHFPSIQSLAQLASDFSSNHTIVRLKSNSQAENYLPEEEVKKVVFIKLMKVAGTTVQGVLYKYAQRYSLKVAKTQPDRRKTMTVRNLSCIDSLDILDHLSLIYIYIIHLRPPKNYPSLFFHLKPGGHLCTAYHTS